jgi:hypothetical protein
MMAVAMIAPTAATSQRQRQQRQRQQLRSDGANQSTVRTSLRLLMQKTRNLSNVRRKWQQLACARALVKARGKSDRTNSARNLLERRPSPRYFKSARSSFICVPPSAGISCRGTQGWINFQQAKLCNFDDIQQLSRLFGSKLYLLKMKKSHGKDTCVTPKWRQTTRAIENNESISTQKIFFQPNYHFSLRFVL